MTAAHLRYVVKATRWQPIAAGALLGAATVAPSHLVDAGPFAAPHFGVALGTVGIALGGAFVLDDPASGILAAVPRTLRRRTLLRIALLTTVAVVALGGLALLAWERLAFADLAAQAGALSLAGVAGAAVAGRRGGWRRPGLVGAAVVAVLLVADGLALLPGDASLLTGGSAAASATAGLWAALAVVALAGLAWGTRDPATRRRRGRPTTKGSRLARWSAPAFVLGGSGLVVGLLSLLVVVRTDAGGLAAVAAVVLLAGGAIIVGLLGLGSSLAGGDPRMARAGTAVVLALAALTALALLAIAALAVLRGIGLAVPAPPEFGLVTAPLFATIVVGSAIFGVASWRAQTPSRSLGGVLLVSAGLWVVAFLVGMRSAELDGWDLLAFLAPAAATIVAGYLLRNAAATPAGPRAATLVPPETAEGGPPAARQQGAVVASAANERRAR